MGTGALMSLGVGAMAASYAQLQTTSNNIANVNTKGYSRQEAQLETAGGQFTGAGFFGKGVNVKTVARAHDEFLSREAALSRSLAAADGARSDQLTRLEKVFGVGEAGLGYAAGQLFNSFADVASKPQDSSARQVVLSRAGELAARFTTAAERIDDLQTGVTQDLRSSVAKVNDLTQQIATLNQRVTDVRGLGQAPNDLLDQRDQLVSDLSQYVQVTTVEAEDGSLSVFMGGGQALVLSSHNTKLAAMPDPYDASRVVIGIETQAGDRQLPTSLLNGGSISGLIHFQAGDLTDARNLLGQMALSIGLQVNQQQSLGLDLLGQTGAAMFRFGSASGLPVVAAQASSANTGTGSVSLTLQAPATLDAALVSGVQASDYELRADGLGGFQMYRLNGGAIDPQFPAVAVANGDVVEGFKISIGGVPAAGDRYLLRPAGNAARDMRLDMSNPKLIAAASPLSATAGTLNQGTAAVAALSAESTAAGAHPNLPATLKFQVTATPGQYTYTWTDGAGTSAAAAWVPGQSIDYPGTTPTNGFQLKITGVPVAADASTTPAVVSDTFTIAPNTYTLADNTNANAMLSLRDTPLVGTIWNGGTLQPGNSVTDAYASILANVGVRVQSAKSAATLSASVAAEAEQNRSGKSGVNLDEEAARLIQYQQAYQAAAKMLQVAQSVFDTLLQSAR
ncbi:MAG: flagellar hook-associated protein FlgK [Burkholderiaceae bacterium]|nr:flagellar hook-associated protein FlgK [Burkholderiaceae bacterium]